MSCTGTFREFEFRRNQTNLVNSLFASEMCPTRAHFGVLPRASRENFRARKRLARERPKCALHGHISALKIEVASILN